MNENDNLNPSEDENVGNSPESEVDEQPLAENVENPESTVSENENVPAEEEKDAETPIDTEQAEAEPPAEPLELEDAEPPSGKKKKLWFSDPVERLEAYNEALGEEKTEKRIGLLRRTAKEVRRYNVALRASAAALAVLVLLTIILYIIAALYMKTGSFTVRVDKVDMTKYGLRLSESRDMFYPTSHLNAEIEKNITNIAEDWLPDNLGMIDGDHSGPNYIAYTFYLQNGGDVEVSYEYSVIMSNVTNALDEAIRLRLYVNDVPTNYAKTRSDGKGPEEGAKEFYSSTLMMKDRKDGFMPGDVTKFTVVLWIEGNDPDCVDWLIGGEMKVEMDFSIVH